MTDEQEFDLFDKLAETKEELMLVYSENKRLRAALEFIASPFRGSCYNCARIALVALEGK